jgi:hypothetical protein
MKWRDRAGPTPPEASFDPMLEFSMLAGFELPRQIRAAVDNGCPCLGEAGALERGTRVRPIGARVKDAGR